MIAKKLYITNKTSIKITFRNPLFSDQGTASIPLQLPAANAKKLLWPHTTNKRATKTFNSDINFNGLNLFRGIFEIEETSENDIQGYFAAGKGEFATAVKGLFLTDINEQEDIVPIGVGYDYFALISEYIEEYPNRNLVFFPSYMPDYTAGEDKITNWDIVNDWDSLTNLFREPSGDFSHIPQFAPSYFLCYVLKVIFRSFGFELEYNFLEYDNELKNLVVFNYNPHEIDFFTGVKASFRTDLPKILISDFLKSIENLFCCKFIINDNKKTVRLIRTSEILLNQEIKDLSEKSFKELIIIHNSEINGVKISQTNNLINLKSDVDITDEYDTLAELPDTYLFGTKVYVRSENFIYSWDSDQDNPDGIWTRYTFVLNDYTEGDGSFEIQTKIGTLQMTNVNRSDFKLLPEATVSRRLFTLPPAAGNIDISRTENVAFLFYRGLVNHAYNPEIDYVVDTTEQRDGLSPQAGEICFVRATQTSYEYSTEWTPVQSNFENFKYHPLASSLDNYINQDDEFITAYNYKLVWPGDSGLINNFWKEYLYFLQNIYRSVTRGLNLTAKDIHNFDFTQKIRIKNKNYFIKEIPVTFTGKTMKIGEVELIEC